MQDGRSPLLIACLRGHHKVVKLLLDVGADVDDKYTVSACMYSVITIIACTHLVIIKL